MWFYEKSIIFTCSYLKTPEQRADIAKFYREKALQLEAEKLAAEKEKAAK